MPNEFQQIGDSFGFNGSQIYAIAKSDLIAGARTPNVVHFGNLSIDGAIVDHLQPAITAIQIEGMHDQGQEISGIDEDITDLILNIKQVRLHCFSEKPVTLYLNVSGMDAVTAADMVVPESVEYEMAVTTEPNVCEGSVPRSVE